MLDESPAKVSGFLNSVKREAVGFNDSDPSVLVSFGLGATATLGIGLTAFTKNWANFGLYLTSLSGDQTDFSFDLILLLAFHLLEYQYAKTFQPKECDSDSFLITQSTESQVAVLAAFIEFFVEKLALCHTSLGDYLPEALKNFKTDWRIWAPAAGCVALFQIIRTISMWTAGSNFHHQVRTEREESHELVTSGIYAWSRHPAYFGYASPSKIHLFPFVVAGLTSVLGGSGGQSQLKSSLEILFVLSCTQSFHGDFSDTEFKMKKKTLLNFLVINIKTTESQQVLEFLLLLGVHNKEKKEPSSI